MWQDTIVSEIRNKREKHAAKFNYNIRAIVRALKEEELKGGRNIVSFSDDTDKKSAIGKTPEINTDIMPEAI